MIYLDHHASAPMVPAARDALVRALGVAHANPSSVHTDGRRVRALIERGRAAFARALGGSPRELVLTSGGTEALDLVIRGVGEASAVRSVCVDPAGHPALVEAARALARDRSLPLAPLPIGRGGTWDVTDVAAFVERQPGPSLVAFTLVHHETGVIAPWVELCRALHASGALCVGDAVQAVGKVPLDLGTSGLAAAAFSAHKFGGAPGVGAAWLAPGVRAVARVVGGAQERGLRAGTENVPGLCSLEAAAHALPPRIQAMPAIAARRDRIEAALRLIDGAVSNGGEGPRVATAAHWSFRHAAGEELVAALDLAGFAVSSGPACSSGRAEPSSALLAAYPDEPWRASSALRITLGPETTDDDVSAFLAAFPRVLSQLRAAT